MLVPSGLAIALTAVDRSLCRMMWIAWALATSWVTVFWVFMAGMVGPMVLPYPGISLSLCSLVIIIVPGSRRRKLVALSILLLLVASFGVSLLVYGDWLHRKP